jgi:RNA polymerase sigma-70 factor (ECF subfamily)
LTGEEFKSLFDEYFDAIRGYIYYRSGDAEASTDIAQETFMKVWEKQFSPEPGKIKGLLYKIAGDLFISRYRKDVSAINYRKSLSFEPNEQTPEDKLQYKELKRVYEEALERMNEKQRTVFLMSRMEELKYSEIAERLGLSVKAVEKRMSNAIAFLKEELKIKSSFILYTLFC